MYGNRPIYFFFMYMMKRQTTCPCACLVLVTAIGWPAAKPKLSRLIFAISSAATSLALMTLSGVPPTDEVDRVAIVVALVRMIALWRRIVKMALGKKHGRMEGMATLTFHPR